MQRSRTGKKEVEGRILRKKVKSVEFARVYKLSLYLPTYVSHMPPPSVLSLSLSLVSFEGLLPHTYLFLHSVTFHCPEEEEEEEGQTPKSLGDRD